MTSTPLLSSAALSRLKWRSRRGMLENDLFIARFFARYETSLNAEHARGLYALMDLSDNDLLDVILRRKTLAALDNHAIAQSPLQAQKVLAMLQESEATKSHG